MRIPGQVPSGNRRQVTETDEYLLIHFDEYTAREPVC